MPFDQSFVDSAISQRRCVYKPLSLYVGPTMDINSDDLQAICCTNLEFC